MKIRVGLLLLIAIIIVLLCACDASSQGNQNQGAENVTRDQAIQKIRNIINTTDDVDINSYPETDKVVDDIRYYYIQVVFENRMSAAYFVDEKEGNVFIAMDGELDIDNLLQDLESVETKAGSLESGEESGVTEIMVSETTVITDIFDTIGMTGEQVEQKFGENYKIVYVDYDGHMEGYLYSDSGLTVAFGDNGKVARVYCSDKIEINGARSGMDFSQIQDILGETSFRQTWAETPIDAAYEIKYKYNDRTVVFFSRQKEGNNSIMSIG